MDHEHVGKADANSKLENWKRKSTILLLLWPQSFANTRGKQDA